MKPPEYEDIKAKVTRVRRRPIRFAVLIALVIGAVASVAFGVACATLGAVVRTPCAYALYGIWPIAVLVAIGFGLAGRARDWLRSRRKGTEQTSPTMATDEQPGDTHARMTDITER